MSDWWGIAWLVILLVLNAFFVGAEFAVISARRSQIEPRSATGSRAAKTALWAMEHATLMLATSQLGITVCSLVILNVSEPAIHHLLEIPLGLTSLSYEAISIIAFVIALLLVTFLHVVLGEMVPKNISFSVPTRAALILAPPLVMVSRVVKPVIWTLNGTRRSAGVRLSRAVIMAAPHLELEASTPAPILDATSTTWGRLCSTCSSLILLRLTSRPRVSRPMKTRPSLMPQEAGGSDSNASAS